jgi:hypothetical protein
MNDKDKAGATAPADENSEKFCLRNQAGEEVGEIDLKRRVGTLKTGTMSGGLISVSLTPAAKSKKAEGGYQKAESESEQ